MSINLKRILYPAMATIMVLPMLATSANATSVKQRNINTSIDNYIAMNIPNRECKYLGLNKPKANGQYSKKQLNTVYDKTYNQNHPQKKSPSVIRQKANRTPKSKLEQFLDQNYAKDMREFAGANINKNRYNNGQHLMRRAKNHLKAQWPVNRRHQLDITRGNVSDFLKSRRNYYYPDINVNFRGLGGYVTRNGKYHVRNRLFRSSNLEHVSRKGKRQLRKLHVNKVIDLRTGRRMKRHPDQRIHGIKYYKVSVFENYKSVQVTRDGQAYMKAHNIHNPYYLMRYRYRKLLFSDPRAQSAYRIAFRILLNNKHGSIDYHCIAGRDRTGMLSALVLSALGIPKSTIIRDYELSSVYEHNMSVSNQRQYINLLYTLINRHYGSMNGYLHHIGITHSQINQLRRMYLAKNR